MVLNIKRVYEPREDQDGTRILVDRLWPRGLTKAEAAVDIWLKDIAPSSELRQWFHKDRSKWEEFRERYTAELCDNVVALDALRQKLREGDVTLLYGIRDATHNHAIIIQQVVTAG